MERIRTTRRPTRIRRLPRAHTIERAAWIAGTLLVLSYAAIRVDGAVGRNAELHRFDETAAPDRKHWSRSRLRAHEASLTAPAGPVIAVLRVPSVDLEVPLYADTSELHLNRGVGLIEHMALPGRGGNLGIAGHRDGYFRALARVRAGDSIELRTRDARYAYRVAFIAVVTASDARLLAPTRTRVVTLVTCFPFYFVGNAPQRFVVRGVLTSSAATAP
jgi:sortase A